MTQTEASLSIWYFLLVASTYGYSVDPPYNTTEGIEYDRSKFIPFPNTLFNNLIPTVGLSRS